MPSALVECTPAALMLRVSTAISPKEHKANEDRLGVGVGAVQLIPLVVWLAGAVVCVVLETISSAKTDATR